MKNKLLRNTFIVSCIAVFISVFTFGFNVAFGAPAQTPPGTGVGPTFTDLTLKDSTDGSSFTVYGSDTTRSFIKWNAAGTLFQILVESAPNPATVVMSMGIGAGGVGEATVNKLITTGDLNVGGNAYVGTAATPKNLTVQGNLSAFGSTISLGKNVSGAKVYISSAIEMIGSLTSLRAITGLSLIDGNGGQITFQTGGALMDLIPTGADTGLRINGKLKALGDVSIGGVLSMGGTASLQSASGTVVVDDLFKVNDIATFVGNKVNLNGPVDSLLNLYTTALNNDATIRLMEGAADNYGFSITHDGGLNDLIIKRHNSSTTGSDSVIIDRATGNVDLITPQLNVTGTGNFGTGINTWGNVFINGKLDVVGGAGVVTADSFKVPNGGSYSLPSGDGKILNADGNPILQTWWKSTFGDYTAINSGYAWTGEEPVSVVAGALGVFFMKGSGGLPYQTELGRITTGGNLKFPAAYNLNVSTLPNRDAYIRNDGYIGYIASSKRFKHAIEDMENVNWLYKLRPVNFVYNEDSTDTKQYGLIAEEVDKVNPSFVSYGEDGLPQTVSYSQLVTPLLKALQDQKKEIDQLREENAEIKAALCEIEPSLKLCN